MRILGRPTRRVGQGDSARLEQILLNLVVNAGQAMVEGGDLRLAVGRVEVDGVDRVRIRVSDTGRGMDTATLARAREPYFTTRSAGTGLGLATVVRLVESLDGTLDLDAEPEGGTVVTVELPTAVNAGA